MTKNLQLIRKPVRLYCTWVPTGDAQKPLACAWKEANTQQAASTAFSTVETERMHLCA